MQPLYQTYSTDRLDALIAELEDEAAKVKSLGLALDMARGKPSQEQCDLSRPMLDTLTSTSSLVDEGMSADNYGVPDGLPSARRLAAELLEVDAKNVLVCGSSSLNIMHDTVVMCYTKGIGGCAPWASQGKIKFLCLFRLCRIRCDLFLIIAIRTVQTAGRRIKVHGSAAGRTLSVRLL